MRAVTLNGKYYIVSKNDNGIDEYERVSKVQYARFIRYRG